MARLELKSVGRSFGVVRPADGVSLTVEPGEIVAVFGPSGSGKTVLLRMIAGMFEPDQGDILVDGRSIVGAAPERRGIGMAFQNFALFPHMTARDNIASGLGAKATASDTASRVEAISRLLKIEHVLGHAPRELSNGQKQRTALARALIGNPDVLLLDDPLRNVDAKLRYEMRLELPNLLRRGTAAVLYVTQDYREAMAIADRIAVMDRGVVAQIGTSRDIYERPANTFVAGFMGTTNLVKGTVNPGIDGHAVFRSTGGLEIRIAQPNSMRVAADANVCIRPEALHLGATCSGVNAWPATVTLSTFLGNAIVYRLDVSGHAFEAHARPDENFEVGANVVVSADPASCTLLLN